MKLTLREISALINGELIGDPEIVITGISGLKEARAGDISFLANAKYTAQLLTTNASAIITGKDPVDTKKAVIRTLDPSLGFTKVAAIYLPERIKHPKGIHQSALISKSARIGKNAAIGAYAVIEDDAIIGENAIIYAGSFIGAGSIIGKDSLIYPHVTIREYSQIGERCIIHSGTVIGSDGFGYVNSNGAQVKIPQVGTVLIEDDVEIGANVTIDRARFDKTIIGKGTKIDNLVQIAHNVIIGQNCTIVAQAGISGSTTIGNNAILAGQAGLVGHIQIGEGAIIAAQAGVTKSVPAHTMVSGYPARPHETARKVNACVQNLPELYRKIKELESRIEELEKNKP